MSPATMPPVQNFPAGHAAHSSGVDSPTTAPIVPLGQYGADSTEDPAGQYFRSGHATGAASILAHVYPAGHGTHELAPAAC